MTCRRGAAAAADLHARVPAAAASSQHGSRHTGVVTPAAPPATAAPVPMLQFLVSQQAMRRGRAPGCQKSTDAELSAARCLPSAEGTFTSCCRGHNSAPGHSSLRGLPESRRVRGLRPHRHALCRNKVGEVQASERRRQAAAGGGGRHGPCSQWRPAAAVASAFTATSYPHPAS